MNTWTSEFAELASYHKLIKGKSPELEHELGRLLSTDDEVVILLYSRRCLEIMVNEICAAKSIKISKTFPLKGIIDKLNKEDMVPSHIISSMLNLNSISTFGAHPKEFDPRQVRTVIINLTTIFEWYLQFREREGPGQRHEEERSAIIGLKSQDKPAPAAGGVTEKKKVKKLSRRLKRVIWLGLIAGNILLVYIIINAANPAHFSDQDWILITDFKNLTGDTVFDQSLNTALEVTIQQSGYVNVFPNARISETLERMGKERTETIDEETGVEVAQREGIKLLVVCDISQVGNVYSLNAKVVEAATQEIIKTATFRANGKDEVLDNLDKLARKLRRTLGESIKSINYQMVALPEATTSSLDALKCLVQGMEAWHVEGHPDEGLDLLQQAIELDPEFAMAHAELGSLYYYIGNREKGDHHYNIVLSLLNRLTEKEKLYIQARITRYRGNYDEASQKYNIYLRKYPNSPDAWFGLGYCFLRLHRYEEAVDAYKKMNEFYQDGHPNALINIAACYNALRKYQLSIDYYLEAFDLNPNMLTVPNLNSEFAFTYVKMGEIEKALEVIKKLMTKEDSYKARGYRIRAVLYMYLGKIDEAIRDLNEAVKINRMTGIKISELRDHYFLTTAYQTKDRAPEIYNELNKAYDLMYEGLEPLWMLRIGKVYVRHGDIQKAEILFDRMHTIMNEGNRSDQVAFDILKGEIELSEGNAPEALEFFESALRLRRNGYTLESLANYYYKTDNLDSAITKYQEIISENALGWEAQEYWIQSHYILAKIYEERGDNGNAIRYYQDFLNIWEDADEDLPDLVDAKSSLQKLIETRP